MEEHEDSTALLYKNVSIERKRVYDEWNVCVNGNRHPDCDMCPFTCARGEFILGMRRTLNEGVGKND